MNGKHNPNRRHLKIIRSDGKDKKILCIKREKKWKRLIKVECSGNPRAKTLSIKSVHLTFSLSIICCYLPRASLL